MLKQMLISTCLLFLLLGSDGRVSAETTSTADYRITFDASWSNTTHPSNSFPAGDHWSALVGTTHNDSFVMWQPALLATSGIKNVAEFGSNGALQSEVVAAMMAGNANQWIQQGFSPNFGAGLATVEITADSDFPLLSLATMIAPSPDWFSGVHDLSLLDAGGNWQPSIAVTVYPYDAGTDSGTSYTASNAITMPFQPIASLSGVAPFSDAPIGTVTITLLPPPTSIALSGTQTALVVNSWWLVALFMLGSLTLLAVRNKVGTQPIMV